ncbi:Uncharacterised protein [uncultured archaeon]|nr:Uncharacterised protein [uncultured archaeon]
MKNAVVDKIYHSLKEKYGGKEYSNFHAFWRDLYSRKVLSNKMDAFEEFVFNELTKTEDKVNNVQNLFLIYNGIYRDAELKNNEFKKGNISFNPKENFPASRLLAASIIYSFLSEKLSSVLNDKDLIKLYLASNKEFYFENPLSLGKKLDFYKLASKGSEIFGVVEVGIRNSLLHDSYSYSEDFSKIKFGKTYYTLQQLNDRIERVLKTYYALLFTRLLISLELYYVKS